VVVSRRVARELLQSVQKRLVQDCTARNVTVRTLVRRECYGLPAEELDVGVCCVVEFPAC
jgi:hypothetical protein